MSKIIYSERALEDLMTYIESYKNYFLDIFSDTGIWSERAIRDQYELLANERHEEIFSAIDYRLTSDILIGVTPEMTMRIPWRTKLLIVTFRETDEGREITRIEIKGT